MQEEQGKSKGKVNTQNICQEFHTLAKTEPRICFCAS